MCFFKLMPTLIANYIVNDGGMCSIIHIAILMYISQDYSEMIVLYVQRLFKEVLK